MNYRNILKVYKLERELSDDETALLNTLRGMTEAERELFAETLQPEKMTKAPTTRVIEKCTRVVSSEDEASVRFCGLTRRAKVHRDGLHEFTTTPTAKSRRASSLKEKIQGTAKSSVVTEEVRCTYRYPKDSPINGGELCNMDESYAVHDFSMGYAGYHPFAPPSTTAPPATRPSAANGGGENSEAGLAEAEALALGD